MSTISRQQYADLFGPTTGDKIRLGDTSLFVSIEKDLRTYGDEAVYGGGKTLRDGMGMDNELTSIGGAPDLLITNVTIIDAVLGDDQRLGVAQCVGDLGGHVGVSERVRDLLDASGVAEPGRGGVAGVHREQLALDVGGEVDGVVWRNQRDQVGDAVGVLAK